MFDAKLSRRDALGLIGAGTLALWHPRPVRAQAAPVIRIGYQATLSSSVDVVAIEDGLYDKAKIKVEARKFDAGRAVRDAMVAGAIDIGGMAVVPFIVGAAQKEMVAVAVTSFFAGTVMLQVKPDSPIKRIEDLRGKKIGTAVGSSTHSVLVEKILPSAGLKKGDYEIVNVAFTNMVPGLTSGSLDAITPNDPHAGLAEHEKLARTLVSFDKFDTLPNMLVVRAAFLQQNEAAVVNALRPWLAAAKMFREDENRFAGIISREYERQGYKLPDSITRQVFTHIKVQPEITPEVRKYLAEQAEVLKAAKQIAVIPDWDVALRPDVLRKAQAG